MKTVVFLKIIIKRYFIKRTELSYNMRMENLPPLIQTLALKHQGGTLFKEHHLEGLLYHRYQALFDQESLQARYKSQWIHNQILLSELRELSKDLQKNNLFAIILKGIHLLEDLYTDVGSRFMSDIDLLISAEKVEIFEMILKQNGYQKSASKTFYGNNFKSEWNKLIGDIEVNIEVHTKLFYHTHNEYWNLEDSSIPYFKKLSREDFLIHLVGHLAFQHTFQKLYWMFDIHLYLEKYHSKIDWKLVFEKSKQLKLERALLMCLWVNRKYFNTKMNVTIKRKWWTYFLTENFLISPEKNKAQYILIKHATKDHLIEALYYDLTWLWHYKLKNRLGLKIARPY